MVKIKLEIITPQQPVVSTDIDEVVVPGILGEFNVLPGHTTFLSELGSGPLVYKVDDRSQTVEISGGVAEVRENQVTVLVDSVIDRKF